MDGIITLLLVGLLLLAAKLGWWVQGRLDARHHSSQSIESVRLMMGMLLTFSALVLGLLTSNAKNRFDGLSDDLSVYAANLIEVDQQLRNYGPAAEGARVLLRRYTAAAIADSWPGERRPAGTYPVFPRQAEKTGLEGQALGELLGHADREIEHLSPQNGMQSEIAARLRTRAESLIGERWKLIFAARSTISWPFLLTLTSWLVIIFAIFGASSPRTRFLRIVVALAAVSIASPVYLILDYGDALGGTIALSSAPMRTALAHMDVETPP